MIDIFFLLLQKAMNVQMIERRKIKKQIAEESTKMAKPQQIQQCE